MNSLTKTLLCLIATLPTVQAVTVIDGDISTGNPRGTDAIDIQSKRELTPQVASGPLSLAFGHSNAASAERSVAIGWENTVSGFEGMAFGDGNQVTAAGAFAFGSAIINSVPNSVMIGPSDGSKLTILSNGTMGIGTTSPSSNEQLDIRGSLAVSAIKGNTTTFNGTPLPGDTAPRKLFFNIQSDGESKKYKIASIQFTGGLSWSSLQGWLQLGGNHAMYERTAEFEIRAFNMHNPSTSELRYIKRGQQTSALSIYKTEDWNGLGHDQYDIYVQTGFHTDAQGEITFITKGNHGHVSVTAWQQGLDCGTGEAPGEQKLPDSDYVFDTSGNIGIGTGTTSPTEKLHVEGNAKITGNLSVSGTFTPAGAVTLANGQTLNLPSAGKINVNTTTPLGSVHVVTTGTIGPAGNFSNSAFTAQSGTQTLGIDSNELTNSGGDLYIQSTTHGIRLNALSATTGDDLIITTDGDVGIGTNYPAAKLHVVGKIYAKTSSGQTFFHGHQFGASYANSQPIFTAQSDNPDGAKNFYFRGQAAGVTKFEVRADGRSYFAGDIGIGTNNLSGGIDDATNNSAISGKLQIFASGADATALLIKGNGTQYAGMKIKVGPGNVSGAPDYYDITVRPSYGPGVNTGPDVSAIRINNTKPRTHPDVLINKDGGNVGIGTTSPAATLDVNGDAKISGGLSVDGLVTKLRVAEQGDISMGLFTASP